MKTIKKIENGGHDIALDESSTLTVLTSGKYLAGLFLREGYVQLSLNRAQAKSLLRQFRRANKAVS